MESGDPADAIILPNCSVSKSRDANESNEIAEVDATHDDADCNINVSPVNLHDSENKNKDDDQDSVIIEEVENKAIELNDDSDEELEPILLPTSGDLSNERVDPQTKATEFVIVNAANLSVIDIADDSEPKNRYRIEDIHIKDELAESVTADVNANDVLENDPMDLLELNNRSDSSASARSQEDTDYADDVSSIGSSSVQTGSSLSATVSDWIKDYPWLLYEEGEEALGFCLYCDAKINIKSQRSVKQHGASLYHKERCENYIAFREEEEKNGLGMKLVEIKEEFGTDSRVEALKLKRKSQSGALNNFNWRRWLEDYPWLERNSPEGTIGFCKYCQIRLNVEFSYLRDRHQEGVKHREAEKQYDEPNQEADQAAQSIVNIEKDKESEVDNSQSNNQRWLEILKDEPSIVRCKLCGQKMLKNNFPRHLRTNLHENNEKMYRKNEKSDEEATKNKQNWKLYTKHHPWLVSDPEDSSIAYCKYCEKRFMYGSSASKRTTHENSSQHKQNEIEFKKRLRKINASKKSNDSDKEEDENDVEDQGERMDEGEEEHADRNEEDKEEEDDDDDEEEGDDDEEDNDGEKENNKDDDEEEEDNEEVDNPEEKESEDDNESKKRIYKKLSDEWINQYPWCKKFRKDPTNFIFCIYCRIPLSVSYSRSKHEKTSFHVSAEKQYLSRQVKKQKGDTKNQINDALPFYEWAIPLRNNPKNYSCRYCRVRISKNYSKKQHASSKIHQINESIYKNNRRKSLRSDENTNTNISEQTTKVELQPLSNIASTKKIQTFAKVVIKAPSTVTLIKQLQKKFTWLTYKRSELRSNYGYCKICDSSLYIRSMKHALRHLRSSRHISVVKIKKKEKTEEEEEVDNNEKSTTVIKKTSKEELQTSPLPTDVSQKPSKLAGGSAEEDAGQRLESYKAYNYKSTLAEMKKRYSWIEKSERPTYAFCRFCDTNIPLKILFLRNHSNSQKHRRSVINYNSAEKKEPSGTNSTDLHENNSKYHDADNDVILLEENNEEILISEQDENWTIKSETMDEHEELDYLLQRSFNNTSNKQPNARRSINADNEPPSKRVKRSHSFRRLNDSNSSLLASLLTTPLTLASCLGPLIQQQIQQQANLSQVSQTSNASTAPESESENTYDLFFKSVSETMKKMPIDIAAEGKLRVMQIICDLELQALKRQQSERGDFVSANNTNNIVNNPAASTSGNTQSVCSTSVTNEISPQQNLNGNEPLITQLNMNAEVSPTNIPSTQVTNASNVDNLATSSPIIGVMDKNGLQTLQFKTSVAKQIPRTTTITSTSVANSGIRCIPFKNLSQPATPDSSNGKLTRIQVPINVPTQNPNQNTPKNLINFRNIQITKRIGTPPTSATTTSAPQQGVQSTPTMTNKNPQRTFITSIQPQLQRWGCSVNGATSHQTPTSSASNHHQQLSSQQTSTPISKR